VNQQKFDVFNYGHNTYLESVPGLVMTGATADAERYIVNGAPNQVGKAVPLARLVTLSQAFQKDTQTSMMSRDT